MGRYDRQRRVAGYGESVDRRFASLRILLVGIGGIGAPVATGLVRAGVGELLLVDPDLVSETDLPRQTLYHPEDLRAGRTKAEAAARELARIGGRSRIDARSVAFTPRSAGELLRGVDLVVDATDHLPAREWIDDACRTESVPWIHTAALGDSYVVIPFLSPGPPCFRCYLPAPPPVAAVGTCESAGVLPVATALAAQHALAAIWRWLRDEGGESIGSRTILRGSVGSAAPRTSSLLPDPACPACRGSARPTATGGLRLLCGRRRAEGWLRLGAEEVRSRLAAGGVGAATARGPLREGHGGDTSRAGSPGVSWRVALVAGAVRAELGDEVITISPGGRLIYGPADDLERARNRLVELLGPDALDEGPPPETLRTPSPKGGGRRAGAEGAHVPDPGSNPQVPRATPPEG